ncbi:MAG: hypothetical protein RR547_09070 [Raoultibacter sp.]
MIVPIKRTEGFTLAELLIVVGILLVLIAIVVPIFANSLGNSEEATCAANRRSIVSMYNAKYTNDRTGDANDMLAECVEEMKAANDGLACPKNGTYSIKSNNGNGGIAVRCSIHGPSLDEEVFEWVSGTFGGPWGNFTDENGIKFTVDTQIREQYAIQNGITEWPSVTGIGKNGVESELYIEFKSYGNSADTTFFYAGTNKDPKKPDWVAYYICDSTGLLGEDSKGQWYQVTSSSNGEGIATTGKQTILNILEKNKDNKVTLYDGKFIAE